MTQFLLGIDAGSSVTKAAVFDRLGNEIAAASARVRLRRDRPGWCEVDPGEALDAACATIKAVLAKAGIDGGAIAGVGLSAAMVGAWLVDARGEAVRPGINWEDSRTQGMLDRRAAEDPDFYARIFRADGCMMQQGCTLPLAAWLGAHEPEAMARAAHVFSYKDFLRMALTGRAAADRTEAAVAPGSARQRSRSAGMMALFGLSGIAAKFPPVLDSERIAGLVTAKAAARTGLRRGTPVAVGAGDVPAAVIGAGALEAGLAMATLGTTCILGAVVDRPVFEPPGLGLLFTLPGELWLRAMVNVAGTLNLDWAAGALMGASTGDPGYFARAEAAVAAVPVGADGVTFLPYLSESGIIAPVVDPRARAGFHGLTARHGQAHMMRAVYEGVVFAMRDLAALLPGASDDGLDRGMILTGGGARSRMWVQMIADCLGKAVHVPAGSEFGARGAALLAAVALGWHASIREASVSLRRIERTQAPDPAGRARWDAAYETYRRHRDHMLTSAAGPA